jgi:hypothetical protein
MLVVMLRIIQVQFGLAEGELATTRLKNCKWTLLRLKKPAANHSFPAAGCCSGRQTTTFLNQSSQADRNDR